MHIQNHVKELNNSFFVHVWSVQKCGVGKNVTLSTMQNKDTACVRKSTLLCYITIVTVCSSITV